MSSISAVSALSSSGDALLGLAFITAGLGLAVLVLMGMAFRLAVLSGGWGRARILWSLPLAFVLGGTLALLAAWASARPGECVVGVSSERRTTTTGASTTAAVNPSSLEMGELDRPTPPDARRRQVIWTVAAGLGACVVGLFWGRWLEGNEASAGPHEKEDDADRSQRGSGRPRTGS